MKVLKLVLLLLLAFPFRMNAQLVIDYGANGNIAANCPSPQTVPLDFDSLGNCILGGGYVTGVDVAPVLEISGSSALAAGSSLTMIATSGSMNGESFLPGGGFRVAGIGGLGVGNNYLDGGEAIEISFDITGLPKGVALKVTSLSFELPEVPGVVIRGNDGASIEVGGFAENEPVSVEGIGTRIPGGTQGVALVVVGSAGSRQKLARVVFEIVSDSGGGGPVDPVVTGNSVVQYPWPDTAPVSEFYTIRMRQEGVLHEVKTLVAKPCLNRLPEGVDPAFDDNTGVTGLFDDRSMSYLPFAFTGEIEVEVTKLYGTTSPRVEIQPKAYGINPHYFDGRTVRFMLRNLDHRVEYISVNFVSADNLDSDLNGGFNVKNGLMLFGDAPETEVPSPDDPGVVVYSDTVPDEELAGASVIYFPPGDHDLRKRYPFYEPVQGQLVPLLPHGAQLRYTRHGQAVYAAGGAFIRGSVWAQGYDNLSLSGRGVFTGEDFWWHAVRRTGDLRKEAFMNFLGSDDSRFEGITIVNPTHHTIPSANRTTIRNLKIIGFSSNHDGVRPASGSLVEEVFIRTSDDYDYARNQHTFRNSVIWPPRNGAFGQLGWNNLGDGYTTYERIFFINSEWHGAPDKRNVGVIGSVLEQGVHLRDNLIQDLYGEDDMGILLHMTIERNASEPLDPQNPGLIENFTFRNIILESDFRTPNGEIFRQPVRGFEYNGAKAVIRDIRFVNLVAGNVLITEDNHATYFDIDPATTANITFTTEGELPLVTVTTTGGGTTRPAGTFPTPAGMDRAVAIEADPGYRIRNVRVDGIDRGRLQTVLFPDIRESHTVEVTFEPATQDTFHYLVDVDGDGIPGGWDGNDLDESIPFQNPGGLQVTPIAAAVQELRLSVAPDLNYHVQVSTDLSTWSTAQLKLSGATVSNPLTAESPDLLKFELSLSPPFFLRVDRAP